MIIILSIWFICSIYWIYGYLDYKSKYNKIKISNDSSTEIIEKLTDYKQKNNLKIIQNPDPKTSSDQYYWRIKLNGEIYYLTDEAMATALGRANKYLK